MNRNRITVKKQWDSIPLLKLFKEVDINCTMNELNNFLKKNNVHIFPNRCFKFKLEQNGLFESDIVIVLYEERLEDDTEYNLRMTRLEERENKIKESNAKQKRYNQYLKLKEEFEDNMEEC